MTKWEHTVKFDSFWNMQISVEEKGRLAATKLKRLIKHFEDDFELEEIIEQFECVSGDGEPSETTEFTVTEDFDARMFDLYDWADYNKVWVQT